MKNVALLSIALLLISCLPSREQSKIDVWKQEILKVEQDFVYKVQDEGISAAFQFYADENAVLLRDGQLIIGKMAISNLYSSQNASDDVTLTWSPDYVDVSSSGDMAYTYGQYLYTFLDVHGNIQQEKGIFHTVWKRQENGEWKYVWD